MTKYVLIVAGGKGLRMGSELPKQFLPIGNGKPVLMHTIEAFYSYDPQVKIILVLPREQQTYWTELCNKHNFIIAHVVAEGGDTRFHSVRNGLALITEDTGIVGVHDGVRPFVSREVIARCYEKAESCKAVIPVIPVTETLRKIDSGGSYTVNRDDYRLVQTPQIFSIEVLKKAYKQPYNKNFTDDASVVEAIQIPIYLTDGNRENIKITTPFDLKIAGVL